MEKRSHRLQSLSRSPWPGTVPPVPRLLLILITWLLIASQGVAALTRPGRVSLPESTPATNERFVTFVQEGELIGLYYLRARHLNAASGRFWTQDSYEGVRGEPRTLHKYLYANADAVNATDPSGYSASYAETMVTMSIMDVVAKAAITTIAVTAYVAHYAGREFTVYAMLAGHSYMYIEKDGTGSGWKYDVFVDRGTLRDTYRRPFDFFEGYVNKSPASALDIPGVRVPVAKFNEGHIPLWESLVQGIAFLGYWEPLPYPMPTPYSRYLYNCWMWTARASITATAVSVLPIRRSDGHFF